MDTVELHKVYNSYEVNWFGPRMLVSREIAVQEVYRFSPEVIWHSENQGYVKGILTWRICKPGEYLTMV